MPESTQPTVVLVHGAFADASGFGGVIRELTASGHRVLAPPNPLRGLAGDAAAVSAAAGAIDGTVVLVGHSYGGAVITQASAVLGNDKHLVSCQQREKPGLASTWRLGETASGEAAWTKGACTARASSAGSAAAA
jgi:pimeloyl-ACP methyl ester carboxylesterase